MERIIKNKEGETPLFSYHFGDKVQIDFGNKRNLPQFAPHIG